MASPSASTPVIDAQSVVGVSGGARGVTAGAVIALAKAHRGRYALLGRTPLSEEPASCRGKSEREIMAVLAQEMAGATPKALRSKADQVLANREIRATLQAIEAAGLRPETMSLDGLRAEIFADRVRQAFESSGSQEDLQPLLLQGVDDILSGRLRVDPTTLMGH